MSAPEPAGAGSPYWSYLAAAAVLTDFAPDKLRPLGGDRCDVAEVGSMLMAHGEPIRIGPAKGRWSLSHASRRSVLAELRSRDRLSDALEANRHSERPDNPTQRAIDLLVARRELPKLADYSLSELLGLERAIELLSPAIEAPAEFRASLLGQIERLRLLEPLQRLVVHGFAGREKESQILRAYVDELESQSFRERLSRQLDNVLDIFRSRPLLVIWGPGGAGKSTLIAKFLLDHAGPQQTRPTPFVYLDFDRGQLDPLSPDSLLAEALRQIQVQFPDFSGKAAGLAADAASRTASEDQGDISRSAHFSQSTQLRERFAALVGEISHASSSKVLFFVDTFEVVQRRGPTPVFNVLTLAAQLVKAMPQLRPVIVGRAALRDSDFRSFADNVPRWKPLPLEGFDVKSGRLYLQGRLSKVGKNNVDATALDQIVKLVRGNPLSLRLAAQVFAKEGIGALENAVAEAEFAASFTQERLQGVLHNRIVDNLPDPVRKIADPGLVVRRLTPEVIEGLLAPHCGLEITPPSGTEQIFATLESEVSLFESTGPLTLRHRPDVRLLMLPLLRAKLGDKAHAIDKAAVEFWSKKDDPEARTEQIYHLLWLGADNVTLDAVWDRGPVSKLLLEDALDEFEALDGAVQARIWLSRKLGREISAELEHKAGLDDWERDAEQRARSLLASGSPQEALSALRVRTERTPDSPLLLLEVAALKLLARDAEALALVDRALDSAVGGRSPAYVLGLLLQKAWLFERADRLNDAYEPASRAAGLALSLGDDTLLFEAKLLQARLARLLGSDNLASLQRELAQLVDKPKVKEALIQRPVLVREASAEVGDLRPELFILASERLSTGRSDRYEEASSLITLGVAHAQRAEFAQANKALEQGRRIARELQDDTLLTRTLLQLASVALAMANVDEAHRFVAEALALAEKLDNPTLKLQGLGILGNVRASAGNLEEAIGYYEESLQTARSTGNRLGEGTALGNLGGVYLGMGEWSKAIDLLSEDLRISQELGDRYGEQQSLDGLATAHWKLGDLERARDLYKQSLFASNTLGDLRAQCATLNNLGAVYAELEDWPSAEGSFKDALAISRQLEDQAAEMNALGTIGDLHFRAGRFEQARDCYLEHLKIADSMSDTLHVARARQKLELAERALVEGGASAGMGMWEAMRQEAPARFSIGAADRAAGDLAQFGKAGHSAEVLHALESVRTSTSALIGQKLRNL